METRTAPASHQSQHRASAPDRWSGRLRFSIRQIYVWRNRQLRRRAFAIRRLRPAETLGPAPGLLPELKTATPLLSLLELAPDGRYRTVRSVLSDRQQSIGMIGYE